MAAKGYCTADDVAEHLGRTFTAAQTTYCNNAIERAERYIDERTGRAWLTGAQTDEAHYPDSQVIFLKYAPVVSVTAITGRAGLGETETSLVANEDYEVRDLQNGEILLVGSCWDRVLVDYTPVATVPADLVGAIIEMVAAWMQPHLDPGSFGVESYSLPDLTVRYARSHVEAVAPPMAQEVIERYCYKVHA
jgi:hypothetical protein